MQSNTNEKDLDILSIFFKYLKINFAIISIFILIGIIFQYYHYSSNKNKFYIERNINDIYYHYLNHEVSTLGNSKILKFFTQEYFFNLLKYRIDTYNYENSEVFKKIEIKDHIAKFFPPNNVVDINNFKTKIINNSLRIYMNVNDEFAFKNSKIYKDLIGEIISNSYYEVTNIVIERISSNIENSIANLESLRDSEKRKGTINEIILKEIDTEILSLKFMLPSKLYTDIIKNNIFNDINLKSKEFHMKFFYKEAFQYIQSMMYFFVIGLFISFTISYFLYKRQT